MKVIVASSDIVLTRDQEPRTRLAGQLNKLEAENLMMVKIMRSGLTSRTKLLFQSTGRDNFCQNEQELIVENLPKARF